MARDGEPAPAAAGRRRPGLPAVARFEDAWGGDPASLADGNEAPLGRDQSNTSAVLGGRLLLKAYRRIRPA